MHKAVTTMIGAIGVFYAAQSQPALTLEKCLGLVRANNLELLNARKAESAGDYFQRELSASQKPLVKALTSVSYAPHSDRLGYDPAITNGGQVGALVSVQTPLYTWGANNLSLKRGAFDKNQLKLQRAVIERAVTLSAEQNFIEICRLLEEEKLRGGARERLAEYLDLVRMQNKGGFAGYSDVLKAQTQLAASEETLVKVRESKTLAKLSLAAVMGAPGDTAFQIEGSVDSMLSAVVAASFALDTSGTPEIAAARADIEKAAIDLELIEKGKFPTLLMTLDGGYQSSMDRFASPDAKTAFGFSVGASLDAPLMDWGVLRYRRERQKLALDTLLISVQIQKRAIAADFDAAALQFGNLFPLLQSTRSRVRDARDDYLLSKSKNASGAVTSAELLLAQQTYTDALADELQTKATIAALAAKLKRFSKLTNEGVHER